MTIVGGAHTYSLRIRAAVRSWFRFGHLRFQAVGNESLLVLPTSAQEKLRRLCPSEIARHDRRSSAFGPGLISVRFQQPFVEHLPHVELFGCLFLASYPRSGPSAFKINPYCCRPIYASYLLISMRHRKMISSILPPMCLHNLTPYSLPLSSAGPPLGELALNR